jgi:hypothetical protein
MYVSSFPKRNGDGVMQFATAVLRCALELRSEATQRGDVRAA